MERFAKIVTGQKPLTFAKRSVLANWQGSEYASTDSGNDLVPTIFDFSFRSWKANFTVIYFHSNSHVI